MSTDDRDTGSETRAEGGDFREAVAQWRLAVRTEVKRVSSLPTAMFDATDPMLEMRLAETTEALLAQLHMPSPDLTAGSESAELRLENITQEELVKLPQQIAERPPFPVDLLSQLAGEYLGVLADSCCMQTGAAQERAAQHICADFGVTPENFEGVLEELHRLTNEAESETSSSHGSVREESEVAAVVAKVAEVIRSQISNGAPAQGIYE